MSKEFQRFCAAEAVPDNGKKAGRVNGKPILVVNTKGKLFAVDAMCSHQEKFLTAGRVRNCRITCPLHGAQFSLETGEALCKPASKPIGTYAVRVVDDWIEVEVESAEA